MYAYVNRYNASVLLKRMILNLKNDYGSFKRITFLNLKIPIYSKEKYTVFKFKLLRNA